MYDIIIIGAGPAGLTSALYALRANKKVLVLEKSTYGGQIINTGVIENYPGVKDITGYDYATNLYEQVTDLNGKIVYEEVVKIDEDKKVYTTKNVYQAKSIIIATGVNRRKLNIPNEEELTGKGVSYCAICDGGFYKNKIVVVNGGGNTAIEDALYLADVAKKVYLIHRRDTFKAEQKYIDELKNKDNVEFVLNSNIISINGKDYVESIDINEDGQERNIPINGLFIAIGQEPNNDNFKNIIELENGYVKSSDGVHTNCKGIYVAGDTRVKDLRQLTTAVSDGATAATVAIKEMEDNYGKRN